MTRKSLQQAKQKYQEGNLDTTLELGKTEPDTAGQAAVKTASWCGGLRNLLMTEVLGEGAYGKVYKVFDSWTGCEYALKVSKNMSAGDIEHEIAVFAALRSHPHILPLLGSALTSGSEQRYAYVAELCSGSLHDWLRRNHLAAPVCSNKMLQRWRFACQAANGLSYMHEMRILHCDVKPLNMLLAQDERILRISDWGLSVFLNEHFRAHVKGHAVYSTMYRPLECLVASHMKARRIFSFKHGSSSM